MKRSILQTGIRMRWPLALLSCAVLLLGYRPARAALPAGTYSINPAGTASATVYRSLKDAISDMTAGTRSDGGTPNGTGISGAVIFEFAPGYDDSLEAFPLIIGSITGASSSNTITIRPSAGVTGPVSITGDGTGINGSVFRLNGSEHLIIDGRPGGVGANKYLELKNAFPSSGYTMFFMNGASNNQVRYCTITSTVSTNYIVVVNAASATTGCNNNIFDNCDIGGFPGTTIAATFISLGTGGRPNTGNTISNCNVFRFRSQGISVSSNNESWTVTGNNVYQPDTTTASVNMSGINIISGSGHTVTNNYVGGSQPQCGGTPWAIVGDNTNSLRGIYIAATASSTNATNVLNNTIANMHVESSNVTNLSSSAFNGIYINSGLVNIESNTIGSNVGNGSIVVRSISATGTPYINGINSYSYTHHNIRNNKIGSITATTNTLSEGIRIYGIRCEFRANTRSVISGNTIGSTTTPNSIHAASAATGIQPVYGISFYAIASTAKIAYVNNTIANLTNNSVNTGSLSPVMGIDAGATDSMVVKGNTIYSLTNTSSSSVKGVNTSNVAGTNNDFSNNTIYRLSGRLTTGLDLNTTGAGGGTVNGNYVHSLVPYSTANSLDHVGIYNGSSNMVLTNNMVRLGIDANGNSDITSAFYGIVSAATTNKLYHNSVYVGGTGVTGGSTRAFWCIAPNTMDIQNNIFVNARSNGSGSGSHFAVHYDYTPSGTINNNLIYAPGTGGLLVRNSTTIYNTLSAWQGAHSFDANSVSADPLFLNATGNADSLDMHLDLGSPAERAIPVISSVTTDYDGENRAAFGYKYIGADAGIYSGIAWNGSNGSTWSTGGNWDGGVAPTATENAYIPAGVSTYPDVTTGTIDIASLLVNKGGRVKMSGGTIRVAGIINNKDTIDAKGGTIVLKDTLRRDVKAGVLNVGNLTIDDTAGVEIKSGTVNVYGTYTPTNGILTANGNLVLKSDTNGTARIAPGATTGNYIADSIIVERHIPGKRSFRFLTHPFTHSIRMSELTDDIDITGAGGAPFTSTVTNNPSAFTFSTPIADNSTTGNNPGWVPFEASHEWYSNQGMRVLVRGAKGEGLNGNNYTPSDVTIDMKGRPVQGDIQLYLSKGFNSDFVMVGNPYPSAVDMSQVARQNVGSAYMMWDANVGLNGGYITNSFSTSSILPAGASFFTTLSGMFFFTMNFTEASKSSDMMATVFKNTAVNHVVELSLEDSTIFWDRLQVHFDSNAMATVDYPDAVKLYNPDMTFYTLSKDDSMLAIDARPFTDKEVIKLGLYSTINKSFKITVPNFSTPAGTKVYLKDNYLNKTEEVTGVGYTYWFATSADKKSWGNDRFELFTEVLPVGITTTAVASNLKVKLAPNPSTNDVNIYCEGMNGKTATVSIVNMMGVQVAAGSTATGHLNVPMQQLPAGMYMVTIQCGAQTITQKVIKK